MEIQRKYIDVWNIDTFDDELRGDLDAHSDLIYNYFFTSKKLWLEREASDHTSAYPSNPYAEEFIWVTEHIMRLMDLRSIRAWHYTRMTDDEVELLRKCGIHLSTIDTLHARLARQVAAGTFSNNVADRLFAASPFQQGQLDNRSNKFWMVSHPICTKDSGVELLLESWGGESIYFWQKDASLQHRLKHIGKPRILELTMPLSHSHHGYSAARAVVATYARSIGADSDNARFDLYTCQPLEPEYLLAIHTEGDDAFLAMARGYPAQYVEGH